MEKIITSLQETIEFGKMLSQQLSGGDILFLYGELGAGKTSLTKGIAKGLGIKDEITSPTFSIMNIYNTTTLEHYNNITTLVHIDTYRLNSKEEFCNIGALDYIGQPNTITIIEWPEKIEELLNNKKITKIKIEHLDNGRKIITN